LTNYLLKQKTIAEVIQTTNVPNLDFMASGKLPNSSMGILGSGQMKEMVSELKQRYDFIFFDSPPILGVSDASILASEMDLVVQIIQYRRYPQPMNIRAKQMIEKVGGNFAGIVLNNINMSQDESYYYYSGYYHDYYYTRSEKEQEESATAPGEKPGPKPDGSGDTEQIGIKQKY
jgi:capsular exopolysaccharide synthesis family protein